MVRLVRLHRLASREFVDAIRRYRKVDPGVSARYREAVNRALDRIARDAESLGRYGRAHRQLRVKRFPYVVYFLVINDSTAVVTAIAHTSRRPNYWSRRRIDLN